MQPEKVPVSLLGIVIRLPTHADRRDMKLKQSLRYVIFPVPLGIGVCLTRVVRAIAVTRVPGPSRVWGPLTTDRVHLLEGQSEDVWTGHHGRFTCCGIWYPPYMDGSNIC